MLKQDDLRQVRSVIKDVLREDHLDKLPDLFGREHHKHRGTHDLTFQQLVDAPDYIDNRQFITIVNEDEDGVTFVDLLGTDHQIVVTKNPSDFTLSLHHQVHIYSDEEAPRVRISNLSDTLELDPVLQFGKGASDDVKFTAGLDDSEADEWALCAGDILTKVATAPTTTEEFDTDGYLWVSDWVRVKNHLQQNLSYKEEFAPTGGGGSLPIQGSCSDGRYIFVLGADDGLSTWTIYKYEITGLAYVTHLNGVYGSTDSDLDYPRSICTDGVHLYIADWQNNRIVKRLCSNLSFVSKTTDVDLYRPYSVRTDGTHVYALQSDDVDTYRLYKYLCSDLSVVDKQMLDDGHLDTALAWSMCTLGGYLYLLVANTTPGDKVVYKYSCSALSYVSESVDYDSDITANGVTSGQCVSVDGTNLFICDYDGSYAYLKKFLLDGTYVSKIGGAIGDGDDEFSSPSDISIYGILTMIPGDPLRAPILRASKDGDWIDSYPVHRFRGQIQLMEDGTVGATNYIGVKAPAAITSSYDLTLPGIGPAAVGHFSVAANGTISWGQDVNTIAGPSFDHVHLTVAIGTAPLVITSTTVVTNLNADLLDGKHEAAFVLIDGTRALTADWDAGAYEIRALTFESDVATGTAPFAVASTTVVANLNADLWDGLDSASLLGLNLLSEPAADRLLFWDYDADTLAWLACGDSIVITMTTIDTAQDIRTTATPTFAGIDLGNVDIDGVNGYVKAGVADTVRGIYTAYGSPTGGSFGGTLACHLADDHNATINNYGFMVYEDDLHIGPDTNTDALILASTEDLYITAGSLVLPASEYVNFGGTLGSAGYGVRDNAGSIEYKDSGGAWASLTAGIGATHGLLSATHNDCFVATAVEGDIIYAISPLPGWPKRKRIDLPVPTANLTDFPLYVPIVADADMSEALATGYDIRFVAADGTTELPYERESWTGGGGAAVTAIFWVKTDVATAGTYIWCYYGNAAAPDVSDPEAVWDADFKAVYHMKDATTSTILDSTGNDNDGVKYAADRPVEADAKIAKGQNFDGTRDRINIGHGASLDITAAITLEAWAYGTNPGRYEQVVAKRPGDSPLYDLLKSNSNKIGFGYGNGAGAWQDVYGDDFPLNQWAHVAITVNGTAYVFYIKGAPAGSGNLLNAIPSLASSDVAIGDKNNPGVYDELWTGLLDEVRISSIARSAEWINYVGEIQAPADGGLTWGAEETTAKWTRLPKGTDGQVLTLVSGLPAWVTP